MSTILSKEFGYTKDGQKVTAFTLSNKNKMTVTILDYGCTIQSITLPNNSEKIIDVVLGYDDVSSYENGSCYYGATIGRYANRIGGASFVLDGKEYQLERNSEEGHNHIHGIFSKKIFKTEIKDDTLVLKYYSLSMEEGFPGNLNVEIHYHLSDDNKLEVNYRAYCDEPTIINLTNHCYFNLNGQDGSTILDHKVKLNSSYYTEYDEHFAQTGRIIPVENTPLDLRNEHYIKDMFYDDYKPFRVCTGYDHNMVIDGKEDELKLIGTAKSENSGISLTVYTSEPAFQFYSGNFIHFDPIKKGKNGVVYPKNGGFCMEAQHYPDSLNHPHFPNTILRPNEIYTQKTIYEFDITK